MSNKKQEKLFKKIPNDLFQSIDNSNIKIEELGCWGFKIYITLLDNINWGYRFTTTLTVLGALMNIDFRKNPSSKKSILDKLLLLEEMDYIKILSHDKKEFNKLKANDIMEIEVISIGQNFTMITYSEMKLFKYFSPLEVSMYCLLKITYNKKYGYSFISQSKMVEILRCSKSSAIQVINQFKELGILNVWKINQFNKQLQQVVFNNRYGFDESTQIQLEKLVVLDNELVYGLINNELPVLELKNKEQLQNELNELELYKIINNVNYVKIIIQDTYQVFEIGEYGNILYAVKTQINEIKQENEEKQVVAAT